LETLTDKKLVPIWIDLPEARAIAMELEHFKLPRPLTHDLIRNILQGIGASLQRVTITDVRNNAYLALLTIGINGKELQIDSRPSDAIAVALRMNAPIFATPIVLAKAKPLPSPGAVGERTRTTLGIRTQDLTPELASLLESQQQRGVLITDVMLASNAMNAGLERGDIITKANDQNITSIEELESLLKSAKPHAHIRLEVIKKGKPTTVVIDLPSP
jgi:bifunctional DNase/RNase